jgi:predicted phosphodiesterase
VFTQDGMVADNRHRVTVERRLILALSLVTYILLGAGAALAGMQLVPASEYRLGPVAIATSAEVGDALSTLRIPPLGTVSAPTHKAPLSLTVTVTELDPQALGDILAGSPDQATLVEDLTVALKGAASGLAVRMLVASLILGGIVLALLPGRRWFSIVAGLLGGVLAAAGLLGATWNSFRPEAFREPSFTGALERAPQVIQAIQGQAVSLRDVRSRVEDAATRLSDVLTLLGQPVDDPHAGTVAILHISDVHSNPLGVEFARRLADRFRVDAILDTGDLTSFGEPIEARIGQLIAEIDIPYLFVPGNHDSEAIRMAVSQIPMVTVLHDRVQEVGGVRIAGWADPEFTARGEVSADRHNLAVLEEGPRVAQAVLVHAPDVLAVHHPLLARASIGRVPLVLAGHQHRRVGRESRRTLQLQVGSAGATGLGSFIAEADLPYEAQIVYFRQGRAVFLDYVSFKGLGNDFQIDRRTLEPAPTPPTAGPSPAGSPVGPAAPVPSPPSPVVTAGTQPATP